MNKIHQKKAKILTLLLFLITALLTGAAKGENPEYFPMRWENPLPFTAYIPSGITEGEALPVLYLLHGQSQDENLWEDMGILPKLNDLLASGGIAPMIVVCPREANYLQDMSESLFPGKLMEELIPLMEKVFPAGITREDRGIGGISRGAVWAQMLAFRHYEMFGVLGLHSLPNPYFSYPTSYRLWQNNKELPFTRIRMDIGIEDPYVSGASEFSRQLTQMRFPHIFVLDEGKHDITYWRKHLQDYLIWYSDQFSIDSNSRVPSAAAALR